MPQKQAETKIDFLFIINPISGDIDKTRIIDVVVDRLSEKNLTYDFYYTSGRNDEEEIEEFLMQNKVETIVVVGGDGTCNMVAKILLGKELKMGIIPAGSANGMAAELELSSNLEENLDYIVKGKSKKVDVLQINEDHICLHLSDIGFNARIIDRFEKGENRGMAAYANSFISELVESKPSSFTLHFDERKENKSAFMIVLANASKFGTGAVINPEGKPDDGIFEVVVLNPQTWLNFFEMIVPFYTRKIHRLDFVETFRCKKIVIENHEAQNVQVDGNHIGQPARVSVEILPQALELIVP